VRARVVPNSGFSDRFQFVSINTAGQMSNEVDYSFAPPDGLERVRADALAFSLADDARYATAAVSATSTNGQYIALLAAKFDVNGMRLWQTRINTALRGFFNNGETTSIVETPNGRVFVVFHPRVVPEQFPTRVCELASDTGAQLSCVDLPTQGRVTHLIAAGDRLHVWVNALGGLAMYELENGVFLPRALFMANHVARTNSGLNGDGLSRYFLTIVSNSDASSGVKYIEVQYAPATSFTFGNGFE
jgi:hypothetical protein